MSKTAPTQRDRFSLVYALVAIVAAIWVASGDELDRDFNLWLLLVPLMLLPAGLASLFLLAALIANLTRRRWRKVASVLVALPIAALAFHTVTAASPYDRFRLERNRARYMADIAHRPDEAGLRLAAWQVGETGGVAVVNVLYFMVYDESGEIARPREAWSDTWRSRARSVGPSSPPLLDPAFGIGVRRLDGHFYLVTETF